MKKSLRVIALALTAGCALTVAGCAKSTQNVSALSSNWYANTSFKSFQPTFVDGGDKFSKESLEYSVTYDNRSAINKYYSVEYSEGTYTTEFYAKKFDKSLTAPEFAEGYPENLTVYYYKTELKIPEVTFKMGEDKRVFENDTVVTESCFLSVADYLRPVYSSQTIKSATPAELQVSDLDSAYSLQNCKYTTYYSYDGKQAKTVAVVDGKTTETTCSGLEKSPNTLFDISSLDVAVRASNLGASLNQAISLYMPTSAKTSPIASFVLKGGALALDTNEDKAKEQLAQVTSALTAKNLFTPAKDDEGNDKPLETIAVRLTTADGKGVSQTYWFSAITNARNNVSRATPVKINVPLTFNLGALNYTLKSVNSTLWQG